MLMSIVSVIADILIFVVLNIEMYTDRAKMPDGQTKEWHRSPVGRLHAAGMDWMLYIQIVFAAVSVISSLLILFGLSSEAVRKIRLISLIASVSVFIIIMIVTGVAQARYA
ncbi:MAG: hypothetical protein II643_01565 [Oscillospiraceae bacterium]|nr:hypothetical protein [Oscillospiraceae bacterium]